MKNDDPQKDPKLSAEEQEARKRLSHLRGQPLDDSPAILGTPEDNLKAKLRKDLARRRGKPIYNSARPVSRTIFKSIYPQLKDKGSGATIASLTQRWPEIVGREVAELCVPLKISKPPTGYVLVLETFSSAAALKLKYQADMILEHVNGACGATFRGIHLQQTKTIEQANKANSKPKRRLTEAEIKSLNDQVENVDNPNMRRALLKLGEAILRKKDKPASPQARRLNRLKSRSNITKR